MKHTLISRGAGFAALAATLLFTGCAPTTPSLYQWTAYQPEVYAYFKGKDSPQQQIDALEKALQEIQAKGHVPPPGFHAQLGMLYASVGNDRESQQEFAAEEKQFPESAPFMDFLMKKPK